MIIMSTDRIGIECDKCKCFDKYQGIKITMYYLLSYFVNRGWKYIAKGPADGWFLDYDEKIGICVCSDCFKKLAEKDCFDNG